MVVVVVDSDDEDVWDRISDIEYNVERETDEKPILIFRECDLFGESSPEFLDLPEELAAEIAAAG